MIGIGGAGGALKSLFTEGLSLPASMGFAFLRRLRRGCLPLIGIRKKRRHPLLLAVHLLCSAPYQSATGARLEKAKPLTNVHVGDHAAIGFAGCVADPGTFAGAAPGFPAGALLDGCGLPGDAPAAVAVACLVIVYFSSAHCRHSIGCAE